MSIAATAALAFSAHAQNATWQNNSGDYADPINWSPASVPTNVATFADPVPGYVITFPFGVTNVNSFVFAPNAGSYQFSNMGTFNFLGDGIVNRSANRQWFSIFSGSVLDFRNSSSITGPATIEVTSGGNLYFSNSSNAGSAEILNSNGVISFYNNSNAGNALIDNYGYIQFRDQSSAGNATITNTRNPSAFGIDFLGASATNFTTAGNATITNYGAIYFWGYATAGNATFHNFAAAEDNGFFVSSYGITFNDFSKAGTARFENDGSIEFIGNASADNATIINRGVFNSSGGIDYLGGLFFKNFATAGNANIENNGGDISFQDDATAGTAKIFNDAGAISFLGRSSAAYATITNDGTIQFDDNATAGHATITNNCCLQFYGNSTAGNSTINNYGTVTFDDNSTAGDARITNAEFGQINFYGNSTAGSATITNNENGYITFADLSTAGSAIIHNAGLIQFGDTANAGNATITITPTGALAFFGNASAADATIVNSSAYPTGLIFADSASAGNATITTTAGSYTIFIDNATGGNARFITTGNGIVDFAEPFGGAVRSAGSIEGTGIFIIGGTTFTVGSNNLSTTLNGVIVDSYGCGCANPAGDLVKVGTGTLTLNGVNTYTGFTEVQDGSLFINGSITSNTSVATLGILGGNGTIFGDVHVQGTLAPGAAFGSIGTLQIDGSITFAAPGVYRVDVASAKSHDRLVLTGDADVSGGTVQVAAAPLTNIAPNDRIAIVTANNIPGNFSGVAHDFLFYDVTLDKDLAENNIFLVFARNAQTFAPFALTPNQKAVAAALDAAGTNNLIGASYQNTPEAVRAALDLLSGEVFATMAGVFLDETAILRNMIFTRLRNTAFTGTAGPLGYLGEYDPALAYASDAQARNPFRALRPAKRGYEYWAQAFGAWAKYDSDFNAGNARRSTGGLAAGLDRMLADGVRAGLSLSYASTQVRVSDRGSKADADTLNLAAYLSKLDGRWSYRTGVALAAHNVNSERSVVGDSLRANYLAATGQVFGEVGYAFAYRELAFEPFANLALVAHATESFRETGANSGLLTSGISKTLGYSTIGMRMATRYELANGWALMPRATLAWQHAIGNLTPNATLTFQGTGTGMTIAGTPLSRDMLLAETGFDVRFSPREILGFFYSANVGTDSTQHAVRGKYEWKF